MTLATTIAAMDTNQISTGVIDICMLPTASLPG
jgi:hypothetical protein